MADTPYKTASSTGVLPMQVHVTAPATLPAGYTFEAEINGDPTKLFTCEVPEGGVEEGQLFLAPLTKSYDGPRITAPTGGWKDGLFGCFNAGFFHPSLCCSLWCSPVAMAQVMTRMQLTWLGNPGPLARTSKTFQVILMLLVAFFIYSIAMEVVALTFSSEEQPMYMNILRIAGDVLFSLWSLVALCNTRKAVRQRYQIPETYCKGCEDVCCSLWCSFCTVSQMMRHTGEYETFPGTCCSTSGHPPGTPLVI